MRKKAEGLVSNSALVVVEKVFCSGEVSMRSLKSRVLVLSFTSPCRMR